MVGKWDTDRELAERGAAGSILTPRDLHKLLSCCFVYLWGQWGQPMGLQSGGPQLCPALLPAQSPTSI